MLSPLRDMPLHVVPAGWWQAPLVPYALVGCCLGPAFEADDFLLLSDLAEHARPEFDPPGLLPAFL
ncbi:MAG: cupin domain-containing protein [Acidithiobacillus sp.]